MSGAARRAAGKGRDTPGADSPRPQGAVESQQPSPAASRTAQLDRLSRLLEEAADAGYLGGPLDALALAFAARWLHERGVRVEDDA